jgi:hypothetical protein
MPGDDLRDAFLKHTDEEIAQEKAAALKRIVETLDRLLGDLHALQTRMATCCPADRPRLEERYGQLRECAREYRWYLRVQCEAIGIRRHDEFDARFPEPPKL